MLGSSPLARGLRLDMRQCGVCIGIIPARAGFTNSHAPTMSPSPDHPRSRGVYAARALRLAAAAGSSPLARGLPVGLTLALTACGSSPLARGLPRAARVASPHSRIIPARAGFTLADPWNPNDEPHYQTAFAFTADLALAPQSSDSAVVSQRLTRTPSEA